MYTVYRYRYTGIHIHVAMQPWRIFWGGLSSILCATLCAGPTRGINATERYCFKRSNDVQWRKADRCIGSSLNHFESLDSLSSADLAASILSSAPSGSQSIKPTNLHKKSTVYRKSAMVKWQSRYRDVMSWPYLRLHCTWSDLATA